MGRGIARMLGFRLPLNFRAPAFAVTPSEFYQRWHVSLSSWIRTFVYDTLAVAVLRRFRSRKTQNYALLIVVLVVMALFGLWHGSAWHFVLFGVAQGLVIVAWASHNRGKPPASLRGKIVSMILLQLTWLFSLVLFRADNVGASLSFLSGLGRMDGWFRPGLGWCLAALALTLAFQIVEYRVGYRPLARALTFLRTRPLGLVLTGGALIATLALKINIDLHHQAVAGAASVGNAGFIYFRF